MHKINASQNDQGTAKILDAQHGPGVPFNRPMFLLDEVVEIFGRAELDGRFTIGVDRFECGEIGAAFVDGRRLGHAILGESIFQSNAELQSYHDGRKARNRRRFGS